MSYDVIVIGGSFAGLSAALQLVRARRRVLVVDAGQPRNRFARASHGFLGHDREAPASLIQHARSQVLSYPTAQFIVGEATEARERAGELEVALASGAIHHTRRLILATGVVDELPDLPGLRERWGATVLHCPYCHGFEVASRRLGVLATGPTAVHQALLLPDWSEEVTLFTNALVTPDDAQMAALEARGVRVETEPVTALLGDAPRLHGVRLGDGRVVALDALFTASRTRQASPLAEQLGCAFDDGPFGPVIRTGERKETTVPGVFAAGDAARPTHNATWASSDGVTAGIGAHQSLALAAPVAVR